MRSSSSDRKRRASALGLGLLGLVAASCARSKPTASAPAIGSWPTEFQRSDAAQRERVALTVYDGFALVREQRRLSLGTGRVALAYEDVSAQIQPASVHLRALDGESDLVVLEQNYRYDLLTPEKLLERYVGRRVSLLRYDRDAEEDVVREAEVLASSQGPVLRVDGELVSLLPQERISFPELPAGLLPRPTLVWLLDSARAEQRVEVSYLTQNLSWHADYVLSLSEDEVHADLTGWVTLDNQTGTSFNAAQLQLVAGDVQRVQLAPAPAPPPLAMRLSGAHAGGGAFREAPLFEYHLYGLERPTDLLAHEQKQLTLLEARGVSVERKLQLRARGRGVPARPQLQHPALVAVLQNREDAGLGLPLPRGVVRVYRADSAGAQQFVGEDALEHTPRDEKIEIELGEAFDVVADRRRLSQRQLERCVIETEWRTELRNHKDKPVVVEVVEPARGGWQLLESTHPAQARDAEAFRFSVPVAARAASELRFRLRLRTCD
jgi:hypothetical protein